MPLPDPLLPAEVDLRDFQYMELDVRTLRDSRFAAQVSGDAFRAGVLLWCAAWHQVPAGSLPDDDVELANLAGYGRFIKEWKKVREEALSKFVKCSDGRLYHEEVCAKAASAWGAKLQHHYDRARDRLRKLNKARADKKLEPIPEFSFEEWNSRRLSGGIPMERAEASGGIPQNAPPPAAGIPAENPLKGNGEGTERERRGNGDSFLSEAIASAASAAPPGSADPPPDPAEAIFALGLPLLTQAGVAEKSARSFLGFLRKQAKERGGDPAVVQALHRCADAKALQPVEFLQGCFKAAAPADAAARRAETTAEAKRLLGFDSQETIDG